jgi:long-chain acyl-CoA synthetase
LMSINGFVTGRRPLFWFSYLLFKPIHDCFGGRLARVIVGGASVDRDNADFFYKIGISVCIGYGLTEVCTAITLNDLRPYRSDTVGKILPGGEVEIRNADEEGVGEVWIRSPFLMSGYFRNEQLTSETIVDGWLRTGDLGCLVSGGHLRFVGRCKNMIVTEGGKNIYPEDVEHAFEHLRDCEENCIFAAHYVWPRVEDNGDQLILVVHPKENARMADDFAEEIRQLNRKLDHHKRISGYLVWKDPFPRTASLKIRRDRLANDIRHVGVKQSQVVSL